MIQLGEGAQDTRRRVPVASLVASDSEEHVLEVLNRFAEPQRRLVTLSAEAEQPVAEVTHEALFSHWGTLKAWLSEGRDDVRFQRRLEEAVDEWHAQKDPTATGLLWRPPLLSLLRDYHEQHSRDMRKEDLAFNEASKKAHQREIDKERARTKLLWTFAIAVGVVAAVAIGVSGFFAFATIHGLDPGETATALMIRYGPKTVPEPEMIEIQPGEGKFPARYRMGSESGDGDERPAHIVTMKTTFAIGRYEVTFEQYDAFVDATRVTNRPDDLGWGRNNRPVINVSWNDAQAYAKWLSAVTGNHYRLPSEAEWEYVARAGTDAYYWWGDEGQQDGKIWANCDGCVSEWSNKQTAPVGSFDANQFGLNDTAGNVWEWVRDCWHRDYNGAPEDGSAWEDETCGQRVVRGGSWVNIPEYLRSANRYRFYPDF